MTSSKDSVDRKSSRTNSNEQNQSIDDDGQVGGDGGGEEEEEREGEMEEREEAPPLHQPPLRPLLSASASFIDLTLGGIPEELGNPEDGAVIGL